VFEGLSDRLGGIFDRLRKRGALSEADVNEALREVRIALLEADVALPVVKEFISGVRGRAIGQEVLRSVTPAQMVVKIVHDHLIEMLRGGEADEKLRAGEGAGINLAGPPPVAVLLVGLQGSGKTTTAGKLAIRLRKREKKRVLMASLDVYRPAAQHQLAVLGQQTDTAVLDLVQGEQRARHLQRVQLEGAHRDRAEADPPGVHREWNEVDERVPGVVHVGDPDGAEAVRLRKFAEFPDPLGGVVGLEDDVDAHGWAWAN
jgi:signal recognition particle subunit SRP54